MCISVKYRSLLTFTELARLLERLSSYSNALYIQMNCLIRSVKVIHLSGILGYVSRDLLNS